MRIFIAVYFIALIIEIIIRVPLDRKRKQEKMSERRVTSQEQILLGLLSLGGLVAPLRARRDHEHVFEAGVRGRDGRLDA